LKDGVFRIDPATSRVILPMTQSPAPRAVSPAQLAPLLELYQRGQCLQAYRLAESLGPLPQWIGTDARLLAGRLAVHLGAPRLMYRFHLLAWRHDRSHPEACYYHARALQDRRGSLAAWRFLQRVGELPAETAANVRSDWLAFHGSVLARFRDFDAAETYLRRAEETCPEQPWTCMERAFVMELEDRYEESLAAERRALELRPWYRPAVQAAAHTLQLLDRDREGLELLQQAAERMESGLILAQLAALQAELGHHRDAQQSYERFAELSPLLEKSMAEWLAARRSDTAYYLGEYGQAAEWARQAKNPFHDKIAEQLSVTPFEGKRVLLDVGFVRQHHQTCAPAVLASLSRFWKMPAEHLDVAAAICYDGTPDHRERAWAEEHGWYCREFAVTWDSARALIDRGVPFTLTTMDPGNAHLQACIGYDTCRKTLLIRDPTLRHWTEFLADTMLEHYRSVGPRGMAMVPSQQAHLLSDLDLPEAEGYDRVYHLQRALQVHDRQRAADIYRDMTASAPDQRLTLQARRILALYDSDTSEILASLEALLQLFPDDPLLTLSKISCLRELGRRDERLTLLQKMCGLKDCDPLFWRQYAQELSADAREHRPAMRLLRRVLRFRPFDEGSLAILANILWDQRRFDEALELYGFAACLGDKDESLACSWFSAARHRKQTERTLRFLQKRFERFGARSSQPARTLYWAYTQYERSAEALAVLDRALQQRPDDGELLLFAAQGWSNHGDFERAGELLRRAEGHSQRSAWLRVVAGLAEARGDLAEARRMWQQVVEAEPLALDANRALAQLIAETEDRAAALAHLQGACERFPHHYALHQLWLGWLREQGAAALEPVVRRLLAIHPADGWTRRELALCLSDQGRLDEAFAELDLAYSLEPTSPSYYCVRGQLCERAGQRREARQAYQEAIRLSVDFDYAIGRLMDTSENRDERRAALALIEAELVRQTIFGDGLLAYQAHARYTLEPEELLASLRKALDERPDLWHAWSAVLRQLVEMDRAGDALALSAEAVERFPLLPQLWFDRALVCRACEDLDSEMDALQHALQIRPNWSAAQRRLAEVYERVGRNEDSLALLQRAVAWAPLDALNRGCLADALWRKGEREDALAQLQNALILDPGYEWAWNVLREWTRLLRRPEQAGQFARQLTERRGDDARSWLMLARMLGDADAEEQLAAFDRALALNPQCVEAYDLKAVSLTRLQRYDEARQACRAAVWDGEVPLILRGRAAWIESECGQLAEAMTLMRSAIVEDPNYYWGWENLAKWARERRADAEYFEASEHLVRLSPHNAVSHGYLAEALWRRDDKEAALERIQQALRLDLSYDWAWDSLRQWAGEMDRRETAIVFARQMTERRPHEARAWLLLAQALDDGEESEERLAALDKALAVNPREEDAHDFKAVALAQSKRFDEALEACEAPIWNGDVPLTLRGRAAWVLYQRGQHEEARQRLHGVVADNPDYYWGWENLAEWTRAAGANADYLHAAENLVRLAPRNPIPYGYRGDARRCNGDRPGAADDYQRALELDPAYRYAGLELFDIQFSNGDLAAAEATLAGLKENAPDAFVTARDVQLAARRGRRAEALEGLQALCADNTESIWPLETAFTAVEQAKWKDDAERILAAALERADTPVHVGQLWIDRHVQRGDYRCMGRFEELLKRGESGRGPIIYYAKALAKVKRRRPLHQCIWRFGAALRENTEDWGNIGYCFASIEDYRAAAEWMRDWPERRDAQPWMLVNLAIALRGLGDDAQANRVSRQALELPDDYTSKFHRVWLALDEALAGQSDAALERLADLDPSSFDVTHKYVHYLIDVMLSLQRAAPAERPSAFRRARRQLDDAVRTMVPLNDDRRALLAVYRRCVRRLARDRGGVPALLWSRWRCWRPMLPPDVKANGALVKA
jgi:tetratricopeptide (TPR) repeat protein